MPASMAASRESRQCAVYWSSRTACSESSICATRPRGHLNLQAQWPRGSVCNVPVLFLEHERRRQRSRAGYTGQHLRHYFGVRQFNCVGALDETTSTLGRLASSFASFSSASSTSNAVRAARRRRRRLRDVHYRLCLLRHLLTSSSAAEAVRDGCCQRQRLGQNVTQGR